MGLFAFRPQFKFLGQELLHSSRPDTIDVYCCTSRQQFLHHLTAGAAWHAGARRSMALGIDAAHGQFNWSFALADRSEKSDTLGATIRSIRDRRER